jgi:hypothetical protein
MKTVYANAGKQLYRFLRADSPHFQSSVEHLISCGEVYLSSRRNFNDPFDMNPILKCDWTISQIRKHAEKIITNPALSSAPAAVIAACLPPDGTIPRKAFSLANMRILKDKFPTYMNELLDHVGVCCFTEDMQNPLFWAHYAGNYAGVCVELRATGDETHPFCNCMKVHYTGDRPIIYASQTGGFDTTDETADWDYIAQYGFCTKSLDWKVEKEWRLWLPPPNSVNRYQALPPKTLKSIFLGSRATGSTTDMVTALSRSMDEPIKVFRTRLSESTFRVEIGERILP